MEKTLPELRCAGDAEMEKGDYREAGKIFRKCLALAKKLNEEGWVVYAYKRIMDVCNANQQVNRFLIEQFHLELD